MSSDDDQQDDPRFEAVLVEYLRQIDKGEHVDQAQFIAEHADFADALRDYFETAGQIERMAAPIEKTLDSDSPSEAAAPPLEVIRYFGDYELLEEIARGGMGVVYKARQVKLNRIVAVKMILSGHLASEGDVKRFYTEAEAAANLEHPNIVPIYEVGEHNGQHYFSMGYIEGESLSQKLADGPLPPQEAANIVEQVAHAIDYAHQRGVLHRDLKPANVLIDSDSQPHVTDFGLAKRVESDSDLTRTGQVLGTPSFMPPEQAAGRLDVVGPVADVYSLGAILYTLLAGRPPFQSANVLDTLKQVVEREPVSPRQLNPAASRDLETICLKCLEKSVARRYATAGELAAELRRFLNDEPIHARPISRTARFWKWCRRNPVVSALSAVCLVAVIVGLIGVTTQWLRAEEEADRANREAEEKSRALVAETRALAKAVTEEQRAKEGEQRAKEAQQRAEKSELDARHNLYVAHMKQIPNAWENNEIARINELLLYHRPPPGKEDLRGFEWYYWWKQTHSYELNIAENQPRASNVADAVALSPDGTIVAAAYWIRSGGFLASNGITPSITVKLRDAFTGELRHTLTDNDPAISAISTRSVALKFVSANKLAVAIGQGRLTFWNLETGEVSRRFDVVRGRRRVPTLENELESTFSADGTRLAIYWDGNVQVWNVLNQEVIFSNSLPEETYRGTNRGTVLSPDGRLLATHSPNGDAKLWDVDTGKPLVDLPGMPLTFSGNGTRLVFRRLPDPEKVRMGERDEQTRIGVWDVEDKSIQMEFEAPIQKHLMLSADGDNLATWGGPVGRVGGAGNIDVWKLGIDGATLNAQYKAHTDSVRAVSFSLDGRRLASCSPDETLKVWTLGDGMAGDINKYLASTTNPVGVSFVRKGGESIPVVAITGAGSRELKLWDLETGETKTLALWEDADAEYAPRVAVSVSLDSQLLAVQTSYGQVGFTTLDDQRWRVTAVRRGHGRPGTTTLSPKGDQVYIGHHFPPAVSQDGSLLVVAYLPPAVWRPSFAFGENRSNPIEIWESSRRQYGRLQLWDVARQELRKSLDISPELISLSQNRLAVLGEGEVFFLDIDRDLSWRISLKGKDQTSLRASAFTNDLRRLATSKRGNLTIWDLESGQLVGTLQAQDVVADVSFGENMLAVISSDRIQTWDTASEDDVLADLHGASKLKQFGLNESKLVASNQLWQLDDFESLRMLSFRNTSITDDLLSTLRGPKSLERLFLDDTLITDAGLEHLKALSSLKTLSVKGTSVTEDGLKLLKTHRPNLRITGPSASRRVEVPDNWILRRHVLRDASDNVIGLLGDSGLQNSDLQTLRDYPLLQSLPINGHVTDEGLAPLSDISQLASLSIGDTLVNGPGLKHLVGLPELVELNLSGSSITDRALAVIPELPHLKTLSLELTNITSDGLKHLRESTTLSELRIRHWHLKPLLVDNLKNMSQLERLELVGDFLSLGEVLDSLPNLNSLTIVTKLGTDTVGHIKRATRIRNLHVGPVSTEAIKQLSEMTHLEGLYFNHSGYSWGGAARITSREFAHIARLTGLKSLGLRRTRITDDDLVALQAFTQLEVLDLADTGIGDAGIAHLAKLPRLREIDLGNRSNESGITDAGVAALAQLAELRRLNLRNSQVTDAGMKHLERLTKLEHLDLIKTKISGDGLRHLVGLEKLRRLSLPEVSSTAIRALRLSLPKCVITPWVPRDDDSDDAGGPAERTKSEPAQGGDTDPGAGNPIGASEDAASLGPKVKPDENGDKSPEKN